jgi:thioredoxin reductase
VERERHLAHRWSERAGFSGAQRLHAAGIPIDERPVVGLRGSDGAIEAVGFDDGTELSLTGMLVPVTLHQRSDLPWQLGAVAKDRGPLAADAIEVDAMFQTGVPGLYAAGDVVVQQAPSVAAAIAAGSTAAAGLVQSLAAEGQSQPAPTSRSRKRVVVAATTGLPKSNTSGAH